MDASRVLWCFYEWHVTTADCCGLHLNHTWAPLCRQFLLKIWNMIHRVCCASQPIVCRCRFISIISLSLFVCLKTLQNLVALWPFSFLTKTAHKGLLAAAPTILSQCTVECLLAASEGLGLCAFLSAVALCKVMCQEEAKTTLQARILFSNEYEQYESETGFKHSSVGTIQVPITCF